MNFLLLDFDCYYHLAVLAAVPRADEKLEQIAWNIPLWYQSGSFVDSRWWNQCSQSTLRLKAAQLCKNTEGPIPYLWISSMNNETRSMCALALHHENSRIHHILTDCIDFRVFYTVHLSLQYLKAAWLRIPLDTPFYRGDDILQFWFKQKERHNLHKTD